MHWDANRGARHGLPLEKLTSTEATLPPLHPLSLHHSIAPSLHQRPSLRRAALHLRLHASTPIDVSLPPSPSPPPRPPALSLPSSQSTLLPTVPAFPLSRASAQRHASLTRDAPLVLDPSTPKAGPRSTIRNPQPATRNPGSIYICVVECDLDLDLDPDPGPHAFGIATGNGQPVEILSVALQQLHV